MPTPEEIAQRRFLQTLRGYDRGQVHAFLEEVAEQVADLERRNAELTAEVEAARADLARLPAEVPAEATAAAPETLADRPFALLGEETQRVLEAAQEAAAAIDRKARQDADRHVKDARQAAARVIAEAERRREHIDESVGQLEQRRDQLARDLAGVSATIDRVLSDLVPAEDAPTVREALTEAAGTVSTTPERRGERETEPPAAAEPAADQAEDAVEPPEDEAPEAEREAAEDEQPPAEPPESQPPLIGAEALVAAEPPEAEPEPPEAEPEPHADAPEPTDDAVPEFPEDAAERSHAAHAADDEASDAAESREDVAATGDAEPAEAPADEPESAEAPADEPESAESAVDEPEPEPTEPTEPAAEAPGPGEVAPTAEVQAGEPDLTAAETSDPSSPVSLRAGALEPVHPKLMRRVKRGMSDVQNLVLDRLRRHGGKHGPEGLVPSEDEMAVLAEVGESFLDQAYEAGVHAAAVLAGRRLGIPTRERALEADFASDGGTRIRETLLVSLRIGLEADEPPAALSDRVGAVFSELKSTVADELSAVHLIRAYEYGLLDAWATGGLGAREWLLGRELRCPEGRCRRNDESGAVSVTEPFPSGHEVPPVHVGCTCTTVPVTEA